MSEELNAPSDGANESVQAVDTAPVEQAPQSEAEKPAISAREAVERAFAKVQSEPEKQTELEKKLRNPNRDQPTGKFTSAPKVDTKPDAATIQPVQEIKPPSRFAKPAQDAWAATPEPVRQEVERALGELQQGIEKYKQGAEAFEPVRKYHDMATQSGTTLEKALDAYVGIETTWRSNPAAGFMAVCQNMQVDPGQMLQAIAHGLQGKQLPRGDSPEVAGLKQQLAQFEQKFGTLEKSITESQQSAKQQAAQTAVNEFASKNPHFDEVADTVAELLEAKRPDGTPFVKDLPDAYAKALRLNPEVAAKVEADKKPAHDPAQTREKAAKSITGSPSTGSIPDSRKPAGSIRDALTNALSQVGA